MLTKDLQIGKVYAVHHRRKGHFKAQLIDIVKADEGDEQDTVLLTMKIDTREGGGQERLARSPGPVTVTNIRPSLIFNIDELPGEDWLIQQRVVEEERPKVGAVAPRESLTDKIRHLFKR
jgi:hypothetical protein